jgi:hypothetical protein
VSHHRAARRRNPLLWAGPLVLTTAIVAGSLVLVERGEGDGHGSDPAGTAIEPAAESTSETDPNRNPAMSRGKDRRPALARIPALKIQPGSVIKKEPPGPVLAKASTGRVGTGLALGPLLDVDMPIGPRVQGPVTASVANLPNRTSAGGFASSMGTLTADGSDFVLLNEVSGRSIDTIQASAPGYGAYRDPAPDRSTGGVQSMNNVVMWRTDRWTLIDGGRVKAVDNDTGFHSGHAFTWDRYATWAMLQRKEDGAIVSVVSTHMPTNPAKFPRQPRNTGMTRVERYSRGMDVLVSTVRTLAQHGPVLLGGDMNSHHSQGAWTAAAKMTAAGYDYVKDQGVMHLFYQGGAQLVSNRQVGVASDHPAIITTLDMNGLGPS